MTGISPALFAGFLRLREPAPVPSSLPSSLLTRRASGSVTTR